MTRFSARDEERKQLAAIVAESHPPNKSSVPESDLRPFSIRIRPESVSPQQSHHNRRSH
jgi:hypothetical protein